MSFAEWATWVEQPDLRAARVEARELRHELTTLRKTVPPTARVTGLTTTFAPSQVFYFNSSNTAGNYTITFGGGEAPLPKEMLAGPLVAYRLWRLFRNAEDVWLAAISRGDIWQPGVPMRGVGVSASGTTGVWAMRGIEDLRPEGYETEHPHGRFVCFLVGKVAIWGKVIEHTKGYRAEYAYPVSVRPWNLGVPMPGFPRARGLTDTLRKVAEVYGIEARE